MQVMLIKRGLSGLFRREGLQSTPNRVARMQQKYRIDPEKLINSALFDADYDEMIVVRHIAV